MKNIKKTIAFICTLAVTAGIMTGCGDKNKVDADQSAAGNKAINISFWEQDDPNAQKVLDKLIAEFQKENTDIVIKRTHVEAEDMKKNYTAASLGKSGPDIVLGANDNLASFVEKNLIVPAVDIVGEEFFKRLNQDSLTAARYNGKQYMIPDRQGNEVMLIYNKKIAAKAPGTFEELVNISKKLQTENKVQYGLALTGEDPLFTLPFLSIFGGAIYDEINVSKAKVTLNTVEVEDWMEFIKGVQSEGIIPKEASYDSANNLFKEGKTAFIINGPWSFSEYKKANLDFGIAVIPSVNGKFPTPYSSVKGYTVSANVAGDKDKKEAVIKFLTHMNGKEAQLKMAEAHNEFPTNLEAINDGRIQNNPLIANQKEQLSKSIPMPIAKETSAVWGAIKEIQQDYLRGWIKLEEVPSKMQKKAEEGIKKLGS